MTFRTALAAIVVASAFAPSAQAAPDPGPLAVKVIEGAILPRYEAFAAATAAQADGWTKACADGVLGGDVQALKDDFQKAADGWAAVEFVTTGPVSESLRPDRIFGPDRRNYVAKALAELYGRAKTGDITPDQMRSVSVAGQGLPALERVLFEPGAAEPAAQCRVGVAISKNLASIAADIVAEWKGEQGPLAKLKRGQGDPLHFADPSQAAARLMTDLAGGAQRMNDVKLLPVLGSGVDAARPKAAEGWRSGRPARSIRITVASLADIAKIFGEGAPKDIAAADAKVFATAGETVAKLPDDLGEATADPKRRKTVEAAVAALKAAQRDVAKNLAPALGLPLGFNALDGD